jgi:predicted dithiol-disulfide oxidoreductase (DUF899 family)
MVNRVYRYLDLVPECGDEDHFKFPIEWVRRHDQYRSTRLTSRRTTGTADGALRE